MIYDVTMTELEQPPKNKLRKVIFKDFTGLTHERETIYCRQINRPR